jgi:mono/diheme cytochrome c family protein
VAGTGLAVGLAIVLAAAPGQAQEHGDPAAGRTLALSVCANCHLVQNGQRQAPMDSVPSFAALARDPAMSDARLHNFLNRPHPPMPNIELSRQQIADLVSYIASLRVPPRPGPAPVGR